MSYGAMTENGLVGQRQQIIAVLHSHGEPVSTSLLRRELNDGDAEEDGSEIDVLYHLGVLHERGFVERTGYVRTGSEGRGQQAQAYRLTEAGRERAKDLFGPVPTETVTKLANQSKSHAAQISEHQDRLNALDESHEQVAALEQRVSELEEQVESHDEVIQDLRSFLERQGAL